MTTSAHLPAHRAVALAEFLTLAGFFGFLLLSDRPRAVGAAMIAAGTVAILGLTAARLRPSTDRLSLWAALSALGLNGATVYLHSLGEVASIPLAGVAVLTLSLLGLVVTGARLWVASPAHHPRA